MPGSQGSKTVNGAQSDPNYVSRLCTGISQNHHPCLLTLPFRTGRYLLFPEVNYRARSECLPGEPKNYSYATDTDHTVCVISFVVRGC